MAVSSVTADRNTRQNPAASPGAISGSVTRRKASIRPHPSDRATSCEPHRGLGDRRQHADQRQREEQDGVGDDQQLTGLVEPERVVDAEEDEAQRDHETGQRLHEVGAAFDHHAEPAAVPHGQEGDRQRQHRWPAGRRTSA